MISLDRNVEDEQAQEALGSWLAGYCEHGLVIYLEGPLGAGKTTFTRGFLRGLGYNGKVKSPTYTLVEEYSLQNMQCFHFTDYQTRKNWSSWE